jgi:hypothetical protein
MRISAMGVSCNFHFHTDAGRIYPAAFKSQFKVYNYAFNMSETIEQSIIAHLILSGFSVFLAPMKILY